MPWLYDKEKLEAAFARSKEKQPNLYLPYDKRLRAWQNNTMRLDPRKKDIKLISSKAKPVKRY